MKRIFVSILLTAILLCSISPSALAANEENDEFKISDWAVESYYKANVYSILNWFHSNDNFTVPITRDEFCDMVFNVVRAMNNGVTAEIDVCVPEPFTDTDRYSVYCLAQLGIVKGVGGGRFDPKGFLTREQAAAVLVRFLEKNGYNSGIYIKDEDGEMTLADLDGLNGKYRSTGMNSYEISYYQGNFASLVVNVTGDTIKQGIFTYQNTGESADLVSTRMDDFTSGMSYNGRYYLGNNAYDVEAGGKQMLELDGETVLTLAADQYGSIGYQKMNGSYVAYAVKDGNADFFTLESGEKLFSVSGSVYRITNKCIITETTRYPEPTVDAAYQVYGVYTLEGTLLEGLGLKHDELYQKGYISDY